MSITYTWTIVGLQTLPLVDGQTDVVVNAQWNLVGSDGTTQAGTSNITQFTYTGGAFTPFDQLTQNQIIGWVQAALGAEKIAQLEAQIATNIGYATNPPVMPINQALPWIPQNPSA